MLGIVLATSSPLYAEPISVLGSIYFGTFTPAESSFNIYLVHDAFGVLRQGEMLVPSTTCSPCLPGQEVQLGERNRVTAVLAQDYGLSGYVPIEDAVLHFDIRAGSVTWGGVFSTTTPALFTGTLTGTLGGETVERILSGMGYGRFTQPANGNIFTDYEFFDLSNTTPVPEPSTLLFLAIGLGGLAKATWKTRIS